MRQQSNVGNEISSAENLEQVREKEANCNEKPYQMTKIAGKQTKTFSGLTEKREWQKIRSIRSEFIDPSMGRIQNEKQQTETLEEI